MTTPLGRFDQNEENDESIERDLFARRARVQDAAAKASMPSLDAVLRAAGTPELAEMAEIADISPPARRAAKASISRSTFAALALAAAFLLGLAFEQMNKVNGAGSNAANALDPSSTSDANVIMPDPAAQAALVTPVAPAAPSLPAASASASGPETCGTPSNVSSVDDESSCQSSCGENPTR